MEEDQGETGLRARRPQDVSDEEDILELDYDRRNPQGSRFTTAGNDADVEDNLPHTYALSTDELYQKLRSIPPECSPTTPCRILSAREDFMKNKTLKKRTSFGERLTHRPKSALEAMTDTITRPEGTVPRLALPNWHCLPLERKIPGIPASTGLIYYSPGKVSTKLHRKPKVYSTKDPYNRERVIGSPYTALHDPHAKDFITRPETKKILYSQGLINENDEIMYSLREFNKFRDYLRTLYADDVQETVQISDDLWKCEQEQVKAIRRYLSVTEGKEALRQTKLKRARWLQRESRDFIKKRLAGKQKQSEARLMAWAKEKELMSIEKTLRNLEKTKIKRERLRNLAEDRRRRTMTAMHESVMKEIQAFERRNHEKLVLKQVRENFYLEWMDAKINFSKERMDLTASNNIAWHESLKAKAKMRQRKMEEQRKNIPKVIEIRKQFEAYRLSLARKYFYIWLNKTRERQRAPDRDDLHGSVFIRGASGTLDQTVEYLRFQSGAEGRLDAFILNILRLKDEIKKQLALEEESESHALPEGETDKEVLI